MVLERPKVVHVCFLPQHTMGILEGIVLFVSVQADGTRKKSGWERQEVRVHVHKGSLAALEDSRPSARAWIYQPRT